MTMMPLNPLNPPSEIIPLKTAILLRNVTSQQLFAHQLAKRAVDALIAEVSLTPKPGLVDKQHQNAHHDMDWALLVKSAKALFPTFYEIAKVSIGHPINQSLREKIAHIGRRGESAMLAETHGINTHKGAIWSLGLMVAVFASNTSGTSITNDTNDSGDIALKRGIQYARTTRLKSHSLPLSDFLQKCGKLASFPDQAYQPKSLSKGQLMQQKWGVNGAYLEAASGFPTLLLVHDWWQDFGYQTLFFADKLKSQSQDQRQGLYQNSAFMPKQKDLPCLMLLLKLMSKVEDTCILSRSHIGKLRTIQTKARQILQDGLSTNAGITGYKALCDYCLHEYLSPGGSADLLASILFLESIGLMPIQSHRISLDSTSLNSTSLNSIS